MEDKLRQGGGPAKIDKQHRDGKLTARERVAKLIDPGSLFLEIGLLIAYDRYDGQAPGAGVVTGLARIEGRPAVIVANDATVKAGAWWPETITKILRAQEIAMRNRLPIVYLVDSAGVNLPLQDGIFPGQYGAARIFYYNSLMRRKLHDPADLRRDGAMCIAGGAYLPALSDVIIMVEGTSFMGLGGPNLVKGAIGQVIDAESLGGESMHTRISGVAHYTAKDDPDCLAIDSQTVSRVSANPAVSTDWHSAREETQRIFTMCFRPIIALRTTNRDTFTASSIAEDLLEFQPDHARRSFAQMRACRAIRSRSLRIGEVSSRQRQARASAASFTRNQRAKSLTSSRTPNAIGSRCSTFRMCPASWSARKPKRAESSGPAPRWSRRWRAQPCPKSF